MKKSSRFSFPILGIFVFLVTLFLSEPVILTAQDTEDWQIEYVYQGGEHSLAMDNTDKPHIAFEIDYGGSNDDSEVFYSSWTSSGWITGKVDRRSYAGSGLSLRMDKNNAPHMGYSLEWGAGIYYANKIGESWNDDKFVKGAWTWNDVTLALDSLDQPHLVCGDNSARELRHYYKEGGKWKYDVIAYLPAWIYDYSTVAVDTDSANNPHVVYNYNGGVYYTRKSGGNWLAPEKIPGQTFMPSRQGMVIDDANIIHVTGSYIDKIVYCRKDGSGWSFEDIPHSIRVVSQASICLDSQGYPHITYIDYTYKKVMHCWKDLAGWHDESIYQKTAQYQEFVDRNDDDYAFYPPYIAIDSSGKPSVTFNLYLYGHRADIFIMHAYAPAGFKNPPLNPSIRAEAKFQYVNQRLVDVYLSAVGAKEMIISEDKNFAGAEWEPYSHFRPFQMRSLATGEYATLYAKFKGDDPSTETEVVLYRFLYDRYPKAFINSIVPDPAVEGETVTFSGYGVDNTGAQITDYKWYIYDCKSSLITSSSETSFSAADLKMGHYNAYFSVKNAQGKLSYDTYNSVAHLTVWDGIVVDPPRIDAAYQHIYERMDLYQTGTPRLIESYAKPYPIYTEKYAFIYDNALAVGALLARGKPEDVERAKLICQKVIELNRRDGIIKDSYYADTYAVTPNTGSSTGNLAWTIIALMQYYLNSGDTDSVFLNDVLETAKHIGGYLEMYCRDRDYYGYQNSRSLTFKSTEHNTTCYVAFMLLYKVSGEAIWSQRALWARRFLTEVVWSDEDRFFWVGTGTDGRTRNTEYYQQAEDANSWPILALGSNIYGGSLDWVEINCGACYPNTPPYQFIGFDFNRDRDGVWFEGTAHMALAYQVAGDTAKSNIYINQLRKAQKDAPNNNGKGIVATPNDKLSTGFGWYYYPSLHIGATAWYLAAEQNYNLFWGTGTNEPVPGGSYLLPYDTIQEGIDNALPGDTIYIPAAEYNEDIILKEGVSLVSSGEGPVIVNGKVKMAYKSSIEGITFNYQMYNGEKDPNFNYSMFHINSSNVIIRDCNFNLTYNGSTPLYYYTSIASITGNNITLEGNTFTFTSSNSYYYMYGLRIGSQAQSSNITLKGNTIDIEDTTTSRIYYIYGVYAYRTNNLILENNIINAKSKTARYGLYGLMCYSPYGIGDDILVKNNTIYLKTDCPSPYNIIGIYSYQVPHINIKNNIISLPDAERTYYSKAVYIYGYYPSTDTSTCTDTSTNTGTDTDTDTDTDTNADIRVTYNIYNKTNTFLYKYPSTLEVTQHDNIKADPEFKDPENKDFHLLLNSPAIDRGDPHDEYTNEPEPKGYRINCGAYGNTEEAAITPRIINVPADYSTINRAVNVSSYGTIIYLKEGTYNENITLPDGVYLIGQGKDKTTVTGKIHIGSDSLVKGITFNYQPYNGEKDPLFNYSMLNINSSNVIIRDCNFNLTYNGSIPLYYYTSIACITGDNITLENNNLTFKSSNSCYYIYGVKVGNERQSSNITLRENKISLEDTSPSYMYYIYAVSLNKIDKAVIENNIISVKSKNAKYSIYGLTLSASSGKSDDILVKNNTIYLKTEYPSPYYLLGIYSYRIPHINIRNNIIDLKNTASSSRAVYIYGYGLSDDIDISVTYNLYNSIKESLYKYPSTLAVTEHDNIIQDPQFINPAAGDFHLLSSSPAIDAGDPSDIYYNEPQPNGGRIDCGVYGNTNGASTH